MGCDVYEMGIFELKRGVCDVRKKLLKSVLLN